MNGLFGKCKVQGHETEILSSVCLQEDCNVGKGLVCSKCISNQGKHFNHSVISPDLFLQKYKELENTSNNSNSNNNSSEKNLAQLKSLQSDLVNLLESLQKSIAEEIAQFSGRLQRQFLIEQSTILASKDEDTEAQSAQIALETATQTTMTPDEATLKFGLLVKRVRMNTNQQLESERPYTEKVNAVIRTAITINQNVSSENAKFTKDVQLYLESIFKFFTQQQNSTISQSFQPPAQRNYNSGSTFGQFSRTNPHQFSAIAKYPEEISYSFGQHQQQQISQPHQPHADRSVSPLPEEYSISPVPVGSQMRGMQAQQTSYSREPQSTEFQSRSNSLTRNIGKASVQAISAHHQSYFNENLQLLYSQQSQQQQQLHQLQQQQQQQFPNSMMTMTQQSTRTVNPPLMSGQGFGYGTNQLTHKNAFQSRQASGNFAKLNNKRVWWKAHEGIVRSIVFLDNDKIASAGEDGIVRLWERLEGKLLATLQGHTKEVECLAYQDTGRILASGSADRTIRVWRPVPAWQCVQSLKGHYSKVGAIIFINDRSMASGGIDGIVQIWDLEKGIAVQSLNAQQTSPISSLLLVSNQLFVGILGKFQIWNITTHAMSRESQDAHNSGAISRIISLKRKGKLLLASAGVDQSVKFWDFHMLSVLFSFKEEFPISDMVYLPQKDSIAVALIPWTTYEQKTATITIWDITTLSRTHAFTENHSPTTALLFDEQYNLLYSAHQNYLVEYNRTTQ